MTSIMAASSVVIMMSRMLAQKDHRKLVPVVQSTASLVIAAQVYSHENRWLWLLLSVIGDAPLIWVLGYANYISVMNILIVVILDSIRLLLMILVIFSQSTLMKWIMWVLSLVSYLPVLFFIYGDVELESFIAEPHTNRRIDRILSLGNYLLVSWAAYPIMATYDMTVHGNIQTDGIIIIDIVNKIAFPLWIVFCS